MAMETGLVVYQPPQVALSQVMPLLGAVVSRWAVKLVPELESPAPFVAVTDPLCVPAEPVNV
jgi:hypothetical protein